MTENQVLNQALEHIDGQSIHEAYEYLVSKKHMFDILSSQYYNYLYCLAALDDKPEDALNYLEEAIVDCELWYRPEVFEDEDLDSIRDTERFKEYQKISYQRYQSALKNSKTVSTWNNREKDCLALALHGNQQNMQDSQMAWGFLENCGYQVEYVQSNELDSCGIYRWEDDGSGAEQLVKIMDSIPWKNYKEKILCGFSSGCNVILQALMYEDISCDCILLQSPWIPMIDKSLDKLAEKLKQKDIKVIVLCGTNDKSCFFQSQRLVEKLKEQGVNVKARWIKGVEHKFSKNYKMLIKKLLKGKKQFELNYSEEGEGEPLILLHGNGEDLTYFEHQIEYFKKKYRVIAIDTRGHGKSPRGNAPFTIRQFAEDLYNFMRNHGIERAHILGFSDGGNIAMIFAMKYPQCVNRLILNGANLSEKGVKSIYQIPITLGYKVAKLFSGKSIRAKNISEMMELMVNDPNIYPEQLKAIQAKTLVIAGTKDMIKMEHTKKIYHGIKNAKLVLIKGNHFIANKQPKVFNAKVDKFLN